MGKKSGLFAFVAGMAAGAAALFLSKEENREKTKKAVEQGKMKAAAEAKKVVKEVKKSANMAQKEVKKATKSAKKTAATVKKSAQKAIKKA